MTTAVGAKSDRSLAIAFCSSMVVVLIVAVLYFAATDTPNPWIRGAGVLMMVSALGMGLPAARWSRKGFWTKFPIFVALYNLAVLFLFAICLTEYWSSLPFEEVYETFSPFYFTYLRALFAFTFVFIGGVRLFDVVAVLLGKILKGR